jgi:hypothetical protein
MKEAQRIQEELADRWPELRATPKGLAGYAIVYNSPSHPILAIAEEIAYLCLRNKVMLKGLLNSAGFPPESWRRIHVNPRIATSSRCRFVLLCVLVLN